MIFTEFIEFIHFTDFLKLTRFIKQAILLIIFLLITTQIYHFIFKKRKFGAFIRLILYTTIFIVFLKVSGTANPLSLLTFEKSELPEGFIYYSQTDENWGNEYYGTSDLIKDTGCGPTVTAMVISSLTDTQINPKEMADWSYNNGYYSESSGSYHTLIGAALENFGLSYTITNSSDDVKSALYEGKYVIALMGNGHFTKSGHFLILCGINENGKVTIADPNSIKNTERLWNFETIASETKYSTTIGGSYWIIENN